MWGKLIQDRAASSELKPQRPPRVWGMVTTQRGEYRLTTEFRVQQPTREGHSTDQGQSLVQQDRKGDHLPQP